ncbi:60S ribosomal protein L23a [Galemys pyrenaicus]|uniref:60S ribosomal protein L23a n=1 Tax=Galemys pyrenaicus TaxID=202257 RepID=A0A8J6AMK8_GALPY|nr:60S ribosomal protein L23a [Galemys pyrenaicus]
MESAMKKREDDNTHVFTVVIEANKYQIKQAVTKPYDIQVTKVNTLIRSDGEKARVQLAADCVLWMLPTKLESSKLSIDG